MGTAIEEQGIARVVSPPQNQADLNFKLSPVLLHLTHPLTIDIKSSTTTMRHITSSSSSLNPMEVNFLSSQESKLEPMNSRDSLFSTLSDIFSNNESSNSSMEFTLPSSSLNSSSVGEKLKAHLKEIDSLKEKFLIIESSFQTLFTTASSSNQRDVSFLASQFQIYQSRVIHINEELVTILVNLDSYVLKEQEANERSARRQLISYIHSLHDRLDLFLKSSKETMKFHQQPPSNHNFST